jgi:hypothetical protein
MAQKRDDMRYMLLLNTDPSLAPAVAPEEAHAEMGKWFAYSQALVAAGAMVAGDPLHDVATATTVRVRGGKTLTTDGPFAETKEILGGYYIIDVPDLDAAIGWAVKVPLAPYGSVEIRAVMELPNS